MARSFQMYGATGNLTRDPEYRTFANGGGVCNFGIAVNNQKKNPDTGKWEYDPCYLDCVCWDRGYNKAAQRVAEFFKKGRPITIQGHLIMDKWDDKTTGEKRYKIKVVVDEFFFVGPKPEDAGSGGNGSQQRQQRQQSSGYNESYEDPQHNDQGVGEEIPF